MARKNSRHLGLQPSQPKPADEGRNKSSIQSQSANRNPQPTTSDQTNSRLGPNDDPRVGRPRPLPASNEPTAEAVELLIEVGRAPPARRSARVSGPNWSRVPFAVAYVRRANSCCHWASVISLLARMFVFASSESSINLGAEFKFISCDLESLLCEQRAQICSSFSLHADSKCAIVNRVLDVVCARAPPLRPSSLLLPSSSVCSHTNTKGSSSVVCVLCSSLAGKQ